MGGTYVLRVEDTDLARGTEEWERDIIDNLHWLGISWDEGPQVAGGEDIGPYAPYRQSQRMELYGREADRLQASGAAYDCYCARGARRRPHEQERSTGAALQRPLPVPDRWRPRGLRGRGRRPALRLRVPRRRSASTT